MERDTNAGINTILIVLLVIAALFIGAWLTRGYWGANTTPNTQTEDRGINVDVNLPNDSRNDTSGNNGDGSQNTSGNTSQGVFGGSVTGSVTATSGTSSAR